jgi:hypothetical protein
MKPSRRRDDGRKKKAGRWHGLCPAGLGFGMTVYTLPRHAQALGWGAEAEAAALFGRQRRGRRRRQRWRQRRRRGAADGDETAKRVGRAVAGQRQLLEQKTERSRRSSRQASERMMRRQAHESRHGQAQKGKAHGGGQTPRVGLASVMQGSAAGRASLVERSGGKAAESTAQFQESV